MIRMYALVVLAMIGCDTQIRTVPIPERKSESMPIVETPVRSHDVSRYQNIRARTVELRARFDTARYQNLLREGVTKKNQKQWDEFSKSFLAECAEIETSLNDLPLSIQNQLVDPLDWVRQSFFTGKSGRRFEARRLLGRYEKSLLELDTFIKSCEASIALP